MFLGGFVSPVLGWATWFCDSCFYISGYLMITSILGYISSVTNRVRVRVFVVSITAFGLLPNKKIVFLVQFMEI